MLNDKDCFGIIYKVTNTINSKVYIGQTIQGLYKRRGSHESRAKLTSDNMPLHKSICKYGKNVFLWEVIEECDSKNELDEMEFHYIKQFNALCPNGYNVTEGGEGFHGYKHSKEIRVLIGKLKTGVKMSKESIDKRSAKQSYKWKIIYPDDHEIIIQNLAKFCRRNNLNAGCMCSVDGGRRKHHKGFKCIKISNRGKPTSEHCKRLISIANSGKKHSIKTKTNEMCASTYGVWSLCVGNNTFIVNNLKAYCRQKELSYYSMLRVARGERNHHKGYKCRKLTNEELYNLEITKNGK